MKRQTGNNIQIGHNNHHFTVLVMEGRQQGTGKTEKVMKYFLAVVISLVLLWLTFTCINENAATFSDLVRILKTVTSALFE